MLPRPEQRCDYGQQPHYFLQVRWPVRHTLTERHLLITGPDAVRSGC